LLMLQQILLIYFASGAADSTLILMGQISH